jgi:hypothetical protein
MGFLRQHRTWFVAIGLWLLAFLPRVVGLGGFLTIDEIKWIEGAGQFALALRSGNLAQTYWHFHPGITIVWGETLALWLGRLLSGGDLVTYVTEQVGDPARTIGLFRLSGALLTSLFAPGVYLLGRGLLDEWAAALAGALVALNPFFLAHSRIVNGDAGAAGFMFLSLLAFLWLWRGSGLWMAALSGALGGLALLTKLPSPLIMPFTGSLAVVGWWRDRRTGFWLKAVLVWGLSALLVFALLWPAVWVNPLGTLQQMLRDTFEVGEAGEGHLTYYRGEVVKDPGWGFYPYAVAFRLTPVVVAGLVLLVLTLGRSKQVDRVVKLRGWAAVFVIYVLFIYVFGSLSPKKLDRYLMAVFPAVDLLAAIGYAQTLVLFGLLFTPTHAPSTDTEGKSQISPAHAPGRANFKLGLWVLIVGVLAVAYVVPNYPYYLSYYNPLLGGIGRAVREVPVGWGEGLEEAAAWLNAQPEAENLRVAAWYSDVFFPYFDGEQVSFSSSGKSQLTADYVVFYVNQVQRQNPYSAVVRYFQSREPAYTLSVRGVPWVWVYRAPSMQIAMPDRTTIEGRAELLGVDLPSSPIEAGDSVAVRLYLRTLGHLPDNERWHVSLVDTDGQSPVAVTKQAISWTPDSVLEYDVVLELPPDLPPRSYSLVVSLWDEAAGQQVTQFVIPESLAQFEVISP